MQKTPTATVNAGPVTPTIIGPDKDMKDVYILSVWCSSWRWWSPRSGTTLRRTRRPIATIPQRPSTVSRLHKSSRPQSTMAGLQSVPAAHVNATPLATRSADILHDDIQFEIGRKGLTDDGKAALRRHAEFLKSEPDLGHPAPGLYRSTGIMSFNKILGLKRAETVKQQLMALGVPELRSAPSAWGGRRLVHRQQRHLPRDESSRALGDAEGRPGTPRDSPCGCRNGD